MIDVGKNAYLFRFFPFVHFVSVCSPPCDVRVSFSFSNSSVMFFEWFSHFVYERAYALDVCSLLVQWIYQIVNIMLLYFCVLKCHIVWLDKAKESHRQMKTRKWPLSAADTMHCYSRAVQSVFIYFYLLSTLLLLPLPLPLLCFMHNLLLVLRVRFGRQNIFILLKTRFWLSIDPTV